MATRAEVEAAIGEQPPASAVVVFSGRTGRRLAFRPGAEGGGAVMVALDVDLLGWIERGGFSARPDALSGFSLGPAERAALRRRREETMERLRQMRDEQAARAADLEASYAGHRAATGPWGAAGAPAAPGAAPGENQAPTQAREGSRAYVI